MKRNRAPPKTSAKKPCQSENENSKGEKDPLQVYCRVRPTSNDNDISCMMVIPPNSLLLTSPEANRNGNYKEVKYTFKQVFDQTTSQEEVFSCTSLALVENLIEGKNSLLFTYGITGSGKTYTMTGVPDDGGIMPRCLDVLFNSISDFQAKKYIFKPDRLNGFDVQSGSDANLERQKELMTCIKTPKLKKKESDHDLGKRQAMDTKIDKVREGNSYAVFITYVEIYNNCVYDLLEDYFSEDVTRQRPLQPKVVREDGSRNMYAHNINEVEVKSSEEAFEVFYKGLKRRRLAHTALNTESSRSHSVFTIRLVQAPLDISGDMLLDDRKKMNISQLSLVDLAGSERAGRTGTYGQRLREAGNINNSLMTLRTCLEILRENQLNGTDKMVPYRESRLTLLFKNYFDGEGDVRMIICVNPRSDDYDESVQVLKFSEMSQEVQVTRPKPVKWDSGLTPIQKKFKNAAVKPLGDATNMATPSTEEAINYRVGPRFPIIQLTDPSNQNWFTEFNTTIQMLKERSNFGTAEIKKKDDTIREQLELLDKWWLLKEKEHSSAQTEIKRLNEALCLQKRRASDLEKKIMEIDAQKSELKIKCVSTEHNLRSLENQLANKEELLNRGQSEIAKEKTRLKNRIAHATERLTKEMETRLMEQKCEMELQMWQKNRQLRKVKKILDGPSSCPAIPLPSTPRSHPPTQFGPSSSSSSSSAAAVTATSSARKYPFTPQSALRTATATTATGSKLGLGTKSRTISVENVLDLATPSGHANLRGREGTMAVCNRRYRRSRSAGGGDRDVWLDHRPEPLVPLNTVMQPTMKKRKSVTKLTDIKDVTHETSKYCLMTQTQDSDGDMETCLYKGDVVPTAGGGAKVMFNDVEILKQKSPNSSPPRKRTGEALMSTPRDKVEDRCAVSLEGHSKRSRH